MSYREREKEKERERESHFAHTYLHAPYAHTQINAETYIHTEIHTHLHIPTLEYTRR